MAECAAKQKFQGCLSSPGLRQPSHLFNSPYILDFLFGFSLSTSFFAPLLVLLVLLVGGGGLSPDRRVKERTSLLVLAQGGSE